MKHSFPAIAGQIGLFCVLIDCLWPISGGNIGYQGFHLNVNQYGQVLKIAGYRKLRNCY